jgi:hypothetical protein
MSANSADLLLQVAARHLEERGLIPGSDATSLGEETRIRLVAIGVLAHLPGKLYEANDRLSRCLAKGGSEQTWSKLLGAAIDEPLDRNIARRRARMTPATYSFETVPKVMQTPGPKVQVLFGMVIGFIYAPPRQPFSTANPPASADGILYG